MKIVDQTYACRVSSSMFGLCPLQCRLRIFHPHSEVSIVIISDMKSMMPWSIRCLAEPFAERIVQEFQLETARLVWLEHSFTKQNKSANRSLTRITFEWCNGKASNPQWVKITPQMAQGFGSGTLELGEAIVST